MIVFKETVVPLNHDEAVDFKHSKSICITDEVHLQIDYLAQHHLFEPNCDAKKVCRLFLQPVALPSLPLLFPDGVVVLLWSQPIM
jgi:hypothetical protein